VRSSPVAAGALLSQGNVAHLTDAFAGKQRDYSLDRARCVPVGPLRSFDGFKRADGPAGTANYWIVIPLVFCENRNLIFMREALTRALGYHKAGPYERYAAALARAWEHGDEPPELDLNAVRRAALLPTLMASNSWSMGSVAVALGKMRRRCAACSRATSIIPMSQVRRCSA